jgi:hypothetical protein
MTQRVDFKARPFGGEDINKIVAQAWRRKCNACHNRDATVRIATFAPLAELSGPQLALLSDTTPGGLPEPVTMRNGDKYVRAGEVFICTSCRPLAEKAVAKHPSSWFVDIDPGAAPDKPVFRREYASRPA